MNQRIQELKEQAMVEQQGHGAFGEPEFYKELDVDKFAELIVRECCQKLETDGMVEVAMEMKQHFGVES